MTTPTITLIYGDGIGQEVISSARRIIEATDVKINWEVCEAGAEVFRKGIATGVPQETIDSISRTRLALKGPLETPVGYGEKSANVTLRKLFETFGNIRPVREMPNVPSPYAGRNIDFVIVRENVEDLYAGIEHMKTDEVAQCLKLISRKGCEKIVRLGFELARAEGRKTVHCATKANIMKLSEGMLKRTFEEIAKDYTDIQAHHIIVDNCAHQLVRFPEKFEVIITTNMNGDILSDLGSGLIGGLGFAPGANIGSDIAIFEAVHGSAPKYAGTNTINPTAVILTAVMMLRHIKEFDAANAIEQAVFVTLEDRIGTKDVFGTKDAVTTSAYTDAIINNLGRTSTHWKSRNYSQIKIPQLTDIKPVVSTDRRVIGVDVFIESSLPTEELGLSLSQAATDLVELKNISNRGVKVFPTSGTSIDTVDLWCGRFLLKDTNQNLTHENIMALMTLVGQKHHWMHIELLNVINGQHAFSKSQGEN